MLDRIQYNPDQKVKGILYSFYKTYKDNYYDIVSVTNSSRFSNKTDGLGIIDFDKNTYWISNAGVGEYVTIHFPYHYIKIEGYEIQSSYLTCNPKEWSFAASNDGVNFEHELITVDENEEMNVKYASKYIPFSYDVLYNYFRLYVKGPSYCNYKRFDVNQIRDVENLI